MLINNDLFLFGLSIISTYSYENERINKNKNSLKTATKSSSYYYTTTKRPNNRDFFIPVFLIESVHYCKSKCAYTKNKIIGKIRHFYTSVLLNAIISKKTVKF